MSGFTLTMYYWRILTNLDIAVVQILSFDLQIDLFCTQVQHNSGNTYNSHAAPALSIRNMVMLLGGLKRTELTEVTCSFAY